MGWGKYADTQSGGQNKGWVEEGNASIYIFSDEPTRCRFLTEDISIEDVMAELKVTREEAEDAIYTKISQDRWIMPYMVWEHTIKEIPGKRFFATAACMGRNKCPMCKENDLARENGINENKFLPYPVRKRFIVPAYFYSLDRVLFVRAAEGFFNSVADYINYHGSDCDFDIYKIGRGFETKYKAVFAGKCQTVPNGGYPPVPLSPRELDITCSEEELKRRIEGGSRSDRQSVQPTQPAPSATCSFGPHMPGPDVQPTQPAPPAVKRTLGKKIQGSKVTPTVEAPIEPTVESKGEFVLPFGQYKGLTFSQLVSAGNGEYVKFLAENSAGAVQKAAREFLGLM